MKNMTPRKWMILGLGLVVVIAAIVLVSVLNGRPDTTEAVAAPTAEPTAEITSEPTAEPTAAPTIEPTAVPTAAPTTAPTAAPTDKPTAAPTTAPTTAPTVAPTAKPTSAPTVAPTTAPTVAPTEAPKATEARQSALTSTTTTKPTDKPTEAPTAAPTAKPTEAPTAVPTDKPTEAPTAAPTPTAKPTEAPTAAPTPTVKPTEAPTAVPTDKPTEAPTVAPTEQATEAPAVTEIPVGAASAEIPAELADAVLGEVYGKTYKYADLKGEIDLMAQRYVDLYALYYGAMMSTEDPNVVGAAADAVLNGLINKEIASSKLTEFGLDTAEAKAEIDAKVEAEYQETVSQYMEMAKEDYPDAKEEELPGLLDADLAKEGYSLDQLRVDIHDSVTNTMLEEKITAGLEVTEEDARAEYAAMVEAAKSQYAASPDSFVSDYLNQSNLTYTPEGFRLIQHVMLIIDTEHDAAAQTAKALEIIAEIQGGKDFLEAAAEYGADSAMSDPVASKGYPVAAGVTGYGEEFAAAALALAKVGDISAEPLVTASYVHILRYAADLSSGEVPFEERKDEYMDSALAEKKTELINKTRDEWWTAAGAKIDTTPLTLYYQTKADGAQAEAEPVVKYGQVKADGASLLDRPDGAEMFKLDAGVTATIEGIIEIDGAVWTYVTLPENAGQGYVKLDAMDEIAADALAPAPEGVHPQTVDAAGKLPTFTLVMNDGGLLYGELYPATAPISVGNFVELANKGFYNGLLFHRTKPDFMIQGGDPEGNGMGGPGYSIKGEFANNQVENPVLHLRGVLSMARTGGAMDSAGSQFFICVADAAHLDGDYATFGMVLAGMEIADRIVSVETGTNDAPVQPQRIRLIHVETYGVEYPFEKLPE